jgi:succinyl-CoA synthetase beta subunit
MYTHEFQAKQVLKRYSIPIPPFHVVSTMEEVEALMQKSSLQQAVLKVQVHAGGRGKAGGVKLAKNPQEIHQAARELLGKKIVNRQTGPEGLVSHQVLITPLVEIVHEYYLGITIDRRQGREILLASAEGGMDIEEVALQTPDKVLVLPIPFGRELRSYHWLRLMKTMGWTGTLVEQGKQIVNGLITAFKETDATLIELNPLVQTSKEQLIALDVKLSIDDNALFRQPILKGYFDPSQVSPREAQAQQHDLAYVALDGEIGCMVNGAGLAMATMDMIHYYGSSPANFLDVGGGASKEKVAEGFKLILSDPKVKAILINIFGGIMNCETLADGIVSAASELEIHIPLVVRMEGTHVEQGKKRLQESELNIQIAHTFSEAAQSVVKAAKMRGSHGDSC